jgi:formate dehydrogenase subunit beta
MSQVDPFTPLMRLNAAQMVPPMLKDSPEKFGAILRPCEIRALIEMVKHDGFVLDRVLTISVDCLGTLPASEYSWRAERRGSPEKLSGETIQFARQGGLLAYRYRSACQLCTAPDASAADINISVLGLPARQSLLVSTRDEALSHELHLETIADGPAQPELVNQHRKLVGRLVERRSRTQERVVEGIAGILPETIDALIDNFASCGSCQSCMDACPLCTIEYPRKGEDNRYLHSDVVRWLVSCAGCGMCEQACPQHQPLSAIFNHIHQEIAREFEYNAGQSVNDKLPALLG